MNYEEKYNEALERARDLMTNQNPPAFDKHLIEIVFPELKESEGERMKKAIMHVLYENYADAAVIEGVEIAEIVAWLEKQGETFTKKDIDDAYLQGICDAKHEIEKQDKKLDPDEVIAWLVANICDYEYYVELFKKDFKL